MTGLPLRGTGFSMPFTIVGKPAFNDPSLRPGAGFGMVTPSFFQTFGFQMVKGRAFADQDRADGVKVMVVNESFVNKYLKGSDPFQQRISVEQLIPGVTKLGPYIEWQIVGVYHTIRGGQGQDNPEMRVPFCRSPWNGANIAVRTAEEPSSMKLKASPRQFTPSIPRSPSRMSARWTKSAPSVCNTNASTSRSTWPSWPSRILLATLGIYGVMSFSVAQRSREIALRMALGADRNRVLALILKEGVLLAIIGSALGLVGAFFIGRSMQSMLFEVGKIDYKVFVAVAFPVAPRRGRSMLPPSPPNHAA